MISPIVAGELLKTQKTHKVINPATGEPFEEIYIASREDAKKAIDLANEAFKKFSAMPLKDRAKILIKAANIVEENKEDFARTLAMEAGKPIKDARVEVLRCISLIRIATEEARFILEGKVHRVDAYEYPPGNENRIVMELREPIGVVGAILPFNFPLNSMAHKVAPTLIAGNTVVVKPSISTPLSAIKLGKAFYDAGLPAGVLSVLPGLSSEVGDEIVVNPSVAGITFTGSTYVGTEITANACKSFAEKCIIGIKPNVEKMREYAESSTMVITAIAPKIGYDNAAMIAKKALETGKSIRQLLIEEKIVSEKDVDKILDIKRMTQGGILA